MSTICAFLLIGCGGGSDSGNDSENQADMDSEEGTDPDAPTVLTGIFVDSAVEGSDFTTASQSGTTNSAGEFSYLEGEQVVFSIGDAVLPSVESAPQVSPVDMAMGSSNPSATITNIARLLQSLDEDGNPDNGITIPQDASVNATAINFDVSVEEFASDTNVINLVANSGSVNASLISAEDANAHLNGTLGIGDTDNIITDGRILTLEQFTATLVGKVAIRRNDDGSRDETTRLISTSDMKTTGTLGGESIELDWYWEDEYYCRSGQSGNVTVELQCQTVTMSDGVATFTDERGAGDSRSYFIEEPSPG